MCLPRLTVIPSAVFGITEGGSVRFGMALRSLDFSALTILNNSFDCDRERYYRLQ